MITQRHALTLRVPQQLYDQLRKMAKERGIDLTPLLIQLLHRGYQMERAIERALFEFRFTKEDLT